MLSEHPRFITGTTGLATAVAVLAGVAQGVRGATLTQAAVTVALATALLAVATIGTRWAERHSARHALTAALLAHALLALCVVLQTSGKAFVMTMPLVSMLVLFLPLGTALLGVAALTTVFALLAARDYSAELVASAIIQVSAAESFVVMFSLLVRRERYARAEVERLQQVVTELAAMKERGRVARDLHDSLGHYLTVMSIQLEAIGEPSAAQAKRVDRLRELVREALLELRRTVSNLRDTPEPELAERLDLLVAEHSSAQLHISFSVSGTPRQTSPLVSGALFRVLQEALTNVRRHARAGQTRVTLSYLPEALQLEVVDDGTGAAGSEGHGLKGMRERVSELGGRLAAGPLPEGGFQVRVELPSPP